MNFDNVTEWRIPEGEVLKVTRNNVVLWEKETIDYTEPFYVENISNTNETLSIKKSASGAPTLSVQYSRDRVNWTSLSNTSTTAVTLTVQPGEKIYLRCNTNSWSNERTDLLDYLYYNTITGISKVGGNIMSLIYGSNFTGQETSFKTNTAAQFACLFKNATRLEQAKDLLLPVTTLNEICYYRLFHGCTSLTTAPKLPATTLAHFCYGYMFIGCTSLTQAPELPANTLANTCYEGMFVGCTSLTTAPVLPATTLAPYCYDSMFRGCTSLNNIKCLATTGIDVQFSTGDWLSNVSSTGTFTKAAGVTWPTGTSGIPSGWTVVEV